MICCTENLVFLWALLFAVHMCVYFLLGVLILFVTSSIGSLS